MPQRPHRFFYGFDSNIKLNGSRASTVPDENLCVFVVLFFFFIQIFDIALQIENVIQCIRLVVWMRALPLKLKTTATINEMKSQTHEHD